MGARVNPAEHLGLVGLIARRYRGRGFEIEELVAEGTLGLMRAVEKFDPTLGYAFTTYAQWWITHAIVHFLNTNTRLVHYPEKRIREGIRNGTLPRNAMSLDADMAKRNIAALDSPKNLHEVLPSDAPGPEVTAADVEERAIVRREVGCLSAREQEILTLRFCDDMTLEQIGECFGLTRERIRQIEKAALAKLRPRLEAAL